MYGRFEKTPTTTVRELLYWSYANLAMAHMAVDEGATTYGRKHYSVRTYYHKAFLTGRKSPASIVADERLKMVLPQVCCYCGSYDSLSIDHFIAKKRGGADVGENTVWACRPCNSSKNASDVLEWYERRGDFPPLLLLRRYLKLVHRYCTDNELMDLPLSQMGEVPFSVTAIPVNYPPPSTLRLWVEPVGRADGRPNITKEG